MHTFFFTLAYPRPTKIRHYVKIIAETKELAMDAFKILHPKSGYSGIYAEADFKPAYNQQLLETVTQRQ